MLVDVQSSMSGLDVATHGVTNATSFYSVD